jgi:hypothetical protein
MTSRPKLFVLESRLHKQRPQPQKAVLSSRPIKGDFCSVETINTSYFKEEITGIKTIIPKNLSWVCVSVRVNPVLPHKLSMIKEQYQGQSFFSASEIPEARATTAKNQSWF